MSAAAHYARLEHIMRPRSVAIIGASDKRGKVGSIILRNYIDMGFTGRIYPINISAGADSLIQGMRAYRRIGDVHRALDLAVIAIPAQAVPRALDECGKAGVKGAVVVSGGFAEVGNLALEAKLKRIAERYSMPVIGPNCLGVMDLRARNDTLFLPAGKLDRPRQGSISFVSQSGAVGSAVLDMMAHEGFGISKFISYGNAAVVDEADLLHYLAHDDETNVVVWYVEGVRRGTALIDLARGITAVKPIIVIKGGVTEQGSLAAHSHTAAMAGSAQSYEALFRQFGFVEAHALEELIDFAKIFVRQRYATGNRVAVITNGGGTGVIATDALYANGLQMARPSAESISALRRSMPSIVNVRMPLDMAGDADRERFGSAMDVLAVDKGIDAFMVIALFQTPEADGKLAAALAAYGISMRKPMVVVSPGGGYTAKQRKIIESAGVPVYDSPNAAAKAMAALIRYSQYRKAVAGSHAKR